MLVPDETVRKVIEALLERPQSLGISSVPQDQRKIIIDRQRDPGVYSRAHNFLRSNIQSYQYALVVFDREGCGQENRAAEELQQEVKDRLEQNGWKGRCEIVVIDPELEVWVWTRSRHVADVLRITPEELDELLSEGKPVRPKETLEEILQRNRIPRSSDLYERLARQVSLRGCTDPAFQLLCETLRRWFPAEDIPS